MILHIIEGANVLMGIVAWSAAKISPIKLRETVYDPEYKYGYFDGRMLMVSKDMKTWTLAAAWIEGGKKVTALDFPKEWT